MTGTAARREAAAFLIGREVSARRACWWLDVSRSWLKYASRRKDDELAGKLMGLAKEHPATACVGCTRCCGAAAWA